MARKAAKMASRKKASVNKSTLKKAKSQMVWPDKLIVSRVIYSALALLLIAGMVWSYLWIEKNYQPQEDFLPIRLVEIEGTLIQVSREEIIQRLLESPTDNFNEIEGQLDKVPTSIGFLASDLELLEQQIETIAWMQNAKLRRVWPDKLHIDVKEHTAIARWNQDSLINEYGEIFTPDSIKGTEHLPLINGPEQELQQLLTSFKQVQLQLDSVELGLRVLNLNHRYSWSLELANGIQLQVGRKNLMERVERFVALYPLLQRESDLPIVKVDLRYDTGLAVQRLQDATLQASL